MQLLPRDVLGKIYIDYFTYDDLFVFYNVCKNWRSAVITSIVNRALMAKEGMDYVEGADWLKTFANRKIIVAVDCSSSMSNSTENWRQTVALEEAMAITRRFKNFAALKGVIFMPFANLCRTIRVKNADQIYREMALVKDDQKNDTGIGESNTWLNTFNSIFNEIHHSKKTSIYLLSDLEIGTHEKMHLLWATEFQTPPKIFLCRIGNSNLGNEFLNFIFPQESTSAEPVIKKKRKEGNVVCVHNHIPAIPERPPVSRSPTVVIEPEPGEIFDEANGAMYDPENVEFDEEVEAQYPTEVDEVDEDEVVANEVVVADEYYPPEDYMDESSSVDYSEE